MVYGSEADAAYAPHTLHSIPLIVDGSVKCGHERMMLVVHKRRTFITHSLEIKYLADMRIMCAFAYSPYINVG